MPTKQTRSRPSGGGRRWGGQIAWVARWGLVVEQAGFTTIAPDKGVLETTQLRSRTRERARALRDLIDGGLDADRTLWEWRERVLRHGAEAASADGIVTLLDVAGNQVAAFCFTAGWPACYRLLGLAADAQGPVLEEVVICHEGLERL